MDPQTISFLVSSAVSFLTPYLAKTGEVAAKKIGEDLYEIIKSRFSKETTAQAALGDLENAPNDKDMQAQLRVQLKKIMDQDLEFAGKIEQTIQDASKTETNATIIKQVAGDHAFQLGQNYGNIEIGKG